MVDGQTDVAAHVREGLGEVARLPVEGIAVQQQDRHPRDRRLAQQAEQQHRVDPVQVEVAVAEPDVQLQRQGRPRRRVDAEDGQQRRVHPRGATLRGPGRDLGRFCAFIAGNSLNTMIPSVPRVASTMCGAAIGIVLAVTGIAANLISFFSIIGASFGPICGAMAADYILSGRRWSGPREGISIAGYGAWLEASSWAFCPCCRSRRT